MGNVMKYLVLLKVILLYFANFWVKLCKILENDSVDDSPQFAKSVNAHLFGIAGLQQ